MPVFWRRVLIFLAIWLLFEGSMSWLATCQPYYEQTTYYSGEKNHCTFLSGPLIGLSIYTVHRLLIFLGANEHELIAGFTIVLAFSTVFLWISTKRLWQTTKDAAAAQARDMQISIKAAEDAARAAEAANVFNRDVFTKTQRAWLSISNVRFEEPLTFNQELFVAITSATFNAINVGPTPAFEVDGGARIIPGIGNIREIFRAFGEELRHRHVTNRVVFPQEVISNLGNVVQIIPELLRQSSKEVSGVLRGFFCLVYGVRYSVPMESEPRITIHLIALPGGIPLGSDPIPPEILNSSVTPIESYAD